LGVDLERSRSPLELGRGEIKANPFTVSPHDSDSGIRAICGQELAWSHVIFSTYGVPEGHP